MSNKAREALSEIIDLIDKWRTDGVMEHWQYSQLFDIADNALAEPLKNWEVGTVREQDLRFDEFCSRNGCDKCPLKETSEDCVLGWAHMPYEKGETDEQ
jgi:hypothetical protein